MNSVYKYNPIHRLTTRDIWEKEGEEGRKQGRKGESSLLRSDNEFDGWRDGVGGEDIHNGGGGQIKQQPLSGFRRWDHLCQMGPHSCCSSCASWPLPSTTEEGRGGGGNLHSQQHLIGIRLLWKEYRNTRGRVDEKKKLSPLHKPRLSLSLSLSLNFLKIKVEVYCLGNAAAAKRLVRVASLLQYRNQVKKSAKNLTILIFNTRTFKHIFEKQKKIFSFLLVVMFSETDAEERRNVQLILNVPFTSL